LLGNHSQVLLGLQQLADARSDLGAMPLDQVEHVCARWVAAVADGDDLADFGDSQSDSLRRLNEGQAAQGVAVVGAVPGPRARRLGQ